MKNILLVFSIIASLIFSNMGLGCLAQANKLKADKKEIETKNHNIELDLAYKKILKQQEPKEMSKAFNFLVNEMNILSSYSGTKMDIVFSQTKDKDSLESYYIKTDFRNVKGLPLTISINKFSKEAELTSILNSIYLLERRTDFKVSEIINESTTLSVKGELYGI